MVCVTGGASGHISSPPVTSPHWSCHSSLVTGQQNQISPSRLSEGCPFQIYLHLDYEEWHDPIKKQDPEASIQRGPWGRNGRGESYPID